MSTKFRYSSGSCYGRDFSDTSPVDEGILAKFQSWIMRPNADGAPATFTADAGSNEITVAGHAFVTGNSVKLTNVGGTLPAPLALLTEYFVIYVGVNTFKLATTYYNALVGTEINIADAGTGTHSIYALGGGAGWYLLDTFANVAAMTFAPTDVNTGTDIVTVTGIFNTFPNYCKVEFSSTTTLPAGVSAGTAYYLRYVSVDSFYVYDTVTNAMIGTATGRINFTSQGTGTHTVTATEKSMVFCDTFGAGYNDYDTSPSGNAPKYLRVGYLDSEAGYIRFQNMLHWNSTAHTPSCYWNGARVATYDSATYAYDFRGGDEFMMISARLGTSWTWAGVDEFIGISSLLEPTTAVGTVQSGLTAGSSVTVQLGAGEAANFVQDKFYYIYDFVGHGWVNYCQVESIDLGTDQIVISNIALNFPAGSVIAAYAHRFYGFSNGYVTNGLNANINCGLFYSVNNDNSIALPYVSCPTQAYVRNNAPTRSYNGNGLGGCGVEVTNTKILNNNPPDDEGNYFAMRALIAEESAGDGTTTSMNRIYGRTKNRVRTYRNTMAQMLDYRIMNGVNWLNYESSGGSYVYCALHTESAV